MRNRPDRSMCVALIVIPLIQFFSPSSAQEMANGVARPENRIFWPVMALISVVLAIQHRDRLAKLSWPPHIICFFAYLAFAGASVLWAFRPEIAFTRFAQQLMIVISIILPAMLAVRTSDVMRGLFFCFAFAAFLNVFFVMSGTATFGVNSGPHGLFREYLGSPGYFSFKNYLGECAAVTLLLALHETLYRGWRRVLGIIVALIATYLVVAANSKTSFGLALICPFLAGLVLITRKVTRISAAIIILSVVLCCALLFRETHYNLNLLSYKLYGDPTFTGRTVIWDFVQREIDRRPFLGWGYESFWLVPGSPARVEAPGWVKGMPNGHNGYYDTALDLGYVGLTFLLAFITATLHATGRVADRDPLRGWLVLSLALFVILYNFLERLWMNGFEFLWVVFVIVAAEIGRHWGPFPLKGVSYSASPQRAPNSRIRTTGPPGACQPRP